MAAAVGMSAQHTGVRRQKWESIISRQVLVQLVNPENCVAGLDLQKQLRGRHLVVEVEGGRSIRIAHQLKILIDLLRFLPASP